MKCRTALPAAELKKNCIHARSIPPRDCLVMQPLIQSHVTILENANIYTRISI